MVTPEPSHGGPPTRSARLTAIVLYYRLGPSFRRTLDELFAQLDADDSVIVVDNASRDGVLDDLRSSYPRMRVLQLLRNRGYAGGMNAGLALAAEAGTELVLLLTHECQLDQGAVSRLRDVVERDASVGIAGPVLVDAAATDRIFSAGGAFDGGVSRPVHRDQRPPATAETVPVEWLDGACLMGRLSTFVQQGGFDERFFLYCEDVDLALRTTQRGLRVVVVPSATAGQSTAGAPPYFTARNRCLLARKHGSPAAARREAAVQLRHAVREALMAPTRGAARQRMRGLRDYVWGRLGPPDGLDDA